jgi:hypothetical protein
MKDTGPWFIPFVIGNFRLLIPYEDKARISKLISPYGGWSRVILEEDDRHKKRMNHYKDSSKSSILKEGLTIQGTLSYMNVRTKSRSKNSSIAFFDIGEKQPVAYNLKHWFRHHPCCLRKYPLRGWLVPSENTNLSSSLLKKYKSACLRKSKSATHLDAIPKAQTVVLPWSVTPVISKGDESLAFGNRLPHEIRHNQQQASSWNWITYCSTHYQPIKGRIGRSLKKAGLCVLLGGFPAFLPHREYSSRNHIISTKEGQLKSFQIINLKDGPKWNCIVSKDQFIRSCARHF